jgi:aminodeoxychorismate lyase
VRFFYAHTLKKQHICNMSFFNYNGKIYKTDTPVIGVDNRGLRYGDGIFETMKMQQGKINFVDEHFARLWKGLQKLQFDIPKNFTPDYLQQQIETTAKKNEHALAGRIRLQIIRGDGGLYDAKNNFPNYIIQTWALPKENNTLNTNGLVVGFYDEVKKNYDAISNLKHNNYLHYVLAALHAKKNKWNDAIVLNTQNNICDTTIANIFLIKDNVVLTPGLNQACVAGVMRNCVINVLKQHNFKVVETSITPEALLQADEIFVTNAIYNIRWIRVIGDSEFGNKTTQQIYNLLLQTID